MITMQKLGMDSYDAILEFDKLCFPKVSWWLDLLKNDRTTYYALMDDNKIIGNLATYNWSGKDDYMKIMGISVHPDHRNKGLATELMKYAEEECISSGLKNICIEILPDNLAMQRVLKKCGYEKDNYVNPIYGPQETQNYFYTNPSYTEPSKTKKQSKNKSAQPKKVINITVNPSDKVALTDSKFGGYPYWPQDKEYPVSMKGEKLILLAQINLSDVKNPLLPKEGLLQFFIGCDDVYGCSYDDDKDFKVIYHKDIDPAVSEESVKSLGIRSAADLNREKDEYFPLCDCYGITFEEGIDKKAGKDSDEDEGITGNKIFGYPFFTQDDPRDDGKYDTLLFQMDSCYGDGYEIMWGDSGVGHFFIEEDDLKNLNFDNVLYTWDCF